MALKKYVAAPEQSEAVEQVQQPLGPLPTAADFQAALAAWLAEVTVELPPADHKSAMSHIAESLERLSAALHERIYREPE